MTSIKPHQITFIVPVVENFDHTEILDFVQSSEIELIEKNKSVRVEELAEMIFGSAESLESYCVHLLLSKDDIYFTVLESKGLFSVYGHQPAVQHAKEAAEKELIEFVKLLKSAREMPSHSKLAKSSWWTEEKIRHRIESLEAYAIDKHYILPHIHQPSTKSDFQLSVKASEMFHLKPSNTENRGSLPTLQRIPSLNPSQNLKHKKFKMSSTLCRWSCFQRLLVGLFEGNAGRNGGIYGPTNFYSMILFSCS
ncbi:RNB domain-containing protein [Forsythia ovata]|uniref:RNB domain-containing protein n=1 Tax=Forsythia ovata TaxID=205694 RepID=A0ABD1WIN5_9LAMI